MAFTASVNLIALAKVWLKVTLSLGKLHDGVVSIPEHMSADVPLA